MLSASLSRLSTLLKNRNVTGGEGGWREKEGLMVLGGGGGGGGGITGFYENKLDLVFHGSSQKCEYKQER